MSSVDEHLVQRGKAQRLGHGAIFLQPVRRSLGPPGLGIVARSAPSPTIRCRRLDPLLPTRSGLLLNRFYGRGESPRVLPPRRSWR